MGSSFPEVSNPFILPTMDPNLSCFPQVLHLLPGRFSYFETYNSEFPYMPTFLPQIIPSAFTSVGLLLWRILPPMAQHFYHLVLKTSSIPLLFFLRNIYKPVSTKTTKAKPKPCYSLKLINQFTFLYLPKVPNEFLHLYLSLYCSHSIPASLI